MLSSQIGGLQRPDRVECGQMWRLEADAQPRCLFWSAGCLGTIRRSSKTVSCYIRCYITIFKSL
ncbi:hypothetical protein BCD48_03325 [Pseudofrankia sp. BMG5.36]|nr:hypothetical protein BCD48_03325 [Pseudofrankia sp. BMG5.36]